MDDHQFREAVIERLTRVEGKQDVLAARLSGLPCEEQGKRVKSLENSRFKLYLAIAGLGGISGAGGSAFVAWLKAIVAGA